MTKEKKEIKEQLEQLILAMHRLAEIDKNYWYNNPDTPTIEVVPFACFGEYDSSCHVERSNFLWLVDNIKDKTGVTLYNSFDKDIDDIFDYILNINAIFVDYNLLHLETVALLTDYCTQVFSYPAIDDAYVSDVEIGMIEHAFNIDIKWELQGRGLDDGAYAVARIWDKVFDGIGTLAYVESGYNVYIDWDKVFDHWQHI